MNLEYLLLSKKPIKITEKLYFHQHTMKEIEESVGYENYEQIIFAATRETYEYKFQFEKAGIDFKDLTFISLFFEFTLGNDLVDFMNTKITKTDRTIQILNFMFNADFKLAQFKINKKNERDTIGFYDEKTKDCIYSDNFYMFKNIFTKMLFIKKPKERFAKNQQAKDLIIRDMELQNRDNIDRNIYSIISSLLWSPNCKETHESIWNLTPYQIYNGFLTVEKIKNFDNTMSGYYHGTINSKDFNIKDIHWTKKII